MQDSLIYDAGNSFVQVRRGVVTEDNTNFGGG
jgi:hypothetical protein